MDMIKVNSKSSSMTDEYLNSKLSRLRLKPSDHAKILRAGDIQIKLCSDPKKSGIDSIKFEPLSNLLYDFAQTPAELNPPNIIWAARWIIKKIDATFSHANWNDNVHDSNKEFPSSVVYQPIINSNPNNYSTVNTDLLRCIQLEKPNYAVIRFDLPIWLKAADLILSQRLPIIPRLGGFHFLKSYLATFGVIFADTGLHEIKPHIWGWYGNTSMVIFMIKLFEWTFWLIQPSSEIIHSFIALENHYVMFPALYSDL